MKGIIRLANVKDAEQIAYVHIQSWKTIYRGHITDEILDRLSLEKKPRMGGPFTTGNRNTYR